MNPLLSCMLSIHSISRIHMFSLDIDCSQQAVDWQQTKPACPLKVKLNAAKSRQDEVNQYTIRKQKKMGRITRVIVLFTNLQFLFSLFSSSTHSQCCHLVSLYIPSRHNRHSFHLVRLGTLLRSTPFATIRLVFSLVLEYLHSAICVCVVDFPLKYRLSHLFE